MGHLPGFQGLGIGFAGLKVCPLATGTARLAGVGLQHHGNRALMVGPREAVVHRVGCARACTGNPARNNSLDYECSPFYRTRCLSNHDAAHGNKKGTIPAQGDAARSASPASASTAKLVRGASGSPGSSSTQSISSPSPSSGFGGAKKTLRRNRLCSRQEVQHGDRMKPAPPGNTPMKQSALRGHAARYQDSLVSCK
jgi:hypothetical protein